MEKDTSSLSGYRPRFEDLPTVDPRFRLKDPNHPYSKEVLEKTASDKRKNKFIRNTISRARSVLSWRQRRKELLQQDMAESQAGVQTFLSMARMAINLAVATEPNKQIRSNKRREMRGKWRQYQQDLLGVVRRP